MVERADLVRCAWSETQDLFIPYHDEEWGVPTHDDRLLFEMLNLEGAQAGLSWLVILRKRAGYRQAFADFEVDSVATFDEDHLAELVLDPGIVRHRQKIAAVVRNARATLAVRDEFGSLDAYVWSFVDGRPIVGGLANGGTEASIRLSKDLKKREFGFVGPTTMYAFMQAVGMINDHDHDCFRLAEVGG